MDKDHHEALQWLLQQVADLAMRSYCEPMRTQIGHLRHVHGKLGDYLRSREEEHTQEIAT